MYRFNCRRKSTYLNKFRTAAIYESFLAIAVLWILPASGATNISPARVEQIAAMLSTTPASFGQPITNRAAWRRVAENPALRLLIPDAEKMAAQPDPEMTDDLYLDCSRTGNRDRGQKVQLTRSARLATFALAECIENQGRFLKPLQKTIEAICSERAWTYPAHDLKLDVFEGRSMHPDLRATSLAFELATADYLLGDKLPAATRQLIRDNVRKRVLVPFRGTVEGKVKDLSWLKLTNNWNAVCLAGTLGAALAIEPSPEERAWYIAAAEHYIHYFLSGFGADGYCYEGIGYWNYGFGHFIMLTEEIRQATDGRLDLFDLPGAVMPAQFASRSEIIGQIYPTISDVTPGTKPDAFFLRYVNERFDLPVAPGFKYESPKRRGNLAGDVFELFAPNPWPPAKNRTPVDDSPLRTWFSDGGVLIDRPNPKDARPFAVVLKGGSNNESHNHNCVGSFSVISGKSMVICDPGGEVYTRRTFSAQRYDSKMLNSFGHAVPTVADKLQATGSAARAVVLRTEFKDDEDVLAFDLRSAYPVPDLKKLERTFTYHRGADAGLRVDDEVVFENPEQFESALITWGDWKAISENEFKITDGGDAVRVRIDTGGAPFTITKSLIDEDVHAPKKPWHIGIILKSVKEAKVSLEIKPVFEKE